MVMRRLLHVEAGRIELMGTMSGQGLVDEREEERGEAREKYCEGEEGLLAAMPLLAPEAAAALPLLQRKTREVPSLASCTNQSGKRCM